MRNLLIFLLVAGMPVTVAAAIYKSVDENGNVVYSDRPSPGAEQIEKKSVTTVPSSVPDVDFSSAEDTDEPDPAYESVRIVSPEDSSAVRANSGNLSVSVDLEPALKQGHEVVLYMDGIEAARHRSPVFQFSNIDRGTHTLVAAVVDSSGSEIARSGLISFTLLRESRLHSNQDIPGVRDAPQPPRPDGPTPTNPPMVNPPGQSPVNPSFPGPTPTNPPNPRAPTS